MTRSQLIQFNAIYEPDEHFNEHQLTNDNDHEVMKRACGEIDRTASAFLPSLRPGETAIIDPYLPIPLTIQIHALVTKPQSDGPK